MSKVINALGRLLRVNYLIIKSLEAVGRDEEDWFQFMNSQAHANLIVQQVLAKVPWLRLDYNTSQVTEMLREISCLHQNNSDARTYFAYDDMFIADFLMREFLEHHVSNNKSDQENKLLLFKMDFKTFFGTTTPRKEELKELADSFGLRELSIDEIIVFRRQYTNQPFGEKLLVSYNPINLFSDSNVRFLIMENILSATDRFGQPLENFIYVKSIGSYNSIPESASAIVLKKSFKWVRVSRDIPGSFFIYIYLFYDIISLLYTEFTLWIYPKPMIMKT